MKAGNTHIEETGRVQRKPPASTASAGRRRLAFARSAEPAVDEQALVRRYTRDRWSQAECARRFGIRPDQVRAILLRNGAQLRTPGSRAPLDEQAVMRAYARHRSADFVAVAMGGRPEEIREILDRHGVPHSSPPRPPEIGKGRRNKPAAARRPRPDAEPTPAEQLWPHQAARMLRLSAGELKTAARVGQITEVRTPGGRRRYARRDVQDLARRLSSASRGRIQLQEGDDHDQ